MNEQTQALLRTIQALDSDQRAALVRALLDAEQEVEEQELLAELDRRSAEAARGQAGAISWADLRDEE